MLLIWYFICEIFHNNYKHVALSALTIFLSAPLAPSRPPFLVAPSPLSSSFIIFRIISNEHRSSKLIYVHFDLNTVCAVAIPMRMLCQKHDAISEIGSGWAGRNRAVYLPECEHRTIIIDFICLGAENCIE